MTIDKAIEEVQQQKLDYQEFWEEYKNEHIEALNMAIDSMRKCQRIAKAIDKVEEYICDVETDTVKAQGMAQALDIFEQALGEVEDGEAQE